MQNPFEELRAARVGIRAPINVARKVANNKTVGTVGRVAGRSSGAMMRGAGRFVRSPYGQGAMFAGGVIGAGYAGKTYGGTRYSIADRSNGIFGV